MKIMAVYAFVDVVFMHILVPTNPEVMQWVQLGWGRGVNWKLPLA